MKFIINGAGGRMGRALTAMIEKGIRGAQLAGAVDPFVEGFVPALEDCAAEADIIIDFSNHESTRALTDYALSRKLPLIVCTTGHTEEELAMIVKN